MEEKIKNSRIGIRKARESDLRALASLCVLAFWDDPLYAWLHPLRNEYFEDFEAWKYIIILIHFYDCVSTFYILYSLEPPAPAGGIFVRAGSESIIGYVLLKGHFDRNERNLAKSKQSWKHCEFSFISFSETFLSLEFDFRVVCLLL